MASSPRSSADKHLGGVALEGVTVRFGPTTALKDVTFSVEPGERLAVVGASGAGKSTLFRALTRSVPLDAGRIIVGGRELYALRKGVIKGVRRRVGTIDQADNPGPQLAAGVNAALGQAGGLGALETLRFFLAGPNGALAKKVEGALDRVGLAGKTRAYTADLSGGQQQRVAVARLLVQRPGLILADEPFAAVDPVTGERVMEALLELNDEGATIFVNLHDVSVARKFPRVVALREGRVAFDGPPTRLSDEALNRISTQGIRTAWRRPPSRGRFAIAGQTQHGLRRAGMASRPKSVPGFGGAIPRFSWPASLALLVLVGLTGWSAYGVGFDLVELLSGGGAVERFVSEMFPPDLSAATLRATGVGIVETFQMSFLGALIGAIVALPLAALGTREETAVGTSQTERLLAAVPYHAARFVLNVFRSVPDIL